MYLFGASGHGKVIAEIAEANNIKIDFFIDQNRLINKILDYPVIHESPYSKIDIIISVGNNFLRKKIVNSNSNFNFIKLFHPNSHISKRVLIGDGSVVMSGVSVNSETIIGNHCIINTNSSIDHECQIGNYVHISPNSALAGNVIVDEGSHIGIGASVIQGIKIGKWCTIGAGAVVINDVPDYAVVVGNPARIIKYNLENI